MTVKLFSDERFSNEHDLGSLEPLEPAGVKYDSGKPRWDLLPFEQVEEVVKVLTSVVQSGKYTDDNWKTVPNARKRYIAAGMRHFKAWICGEKLDKETGLNHLAHAICCLLFLMWGDVRENINKI